MTEPDLYLDADACPVKEEALRVAERHGLTTFLVSNGGLRPRRDPSMVVVTVAREPDAADAWIRDRVRPGDVVVTGDVPLAAACVERGAIVIGHDGERFTAQTIGNRLAMRDLMADLRSADPFMTAGRGRSFGKADRARFLDALERAVRTARRIRGQDGSAPPAPDDPA